MEHFDAIIIGFGKGGKLLAADLANRGQQVAIIVRLRCTEAPASISPVFRPKH